MQLLYRALAALQFLRYFADAPAISKAPEHDAALLGREAVDQFVEHGALLHLLQSGFIHRLRRVIASLTRSPLMTICNPVGSYSQQPGDKRYAAPLILRQVAQRLDPGITDLATMLFRNEEALLRGATDVEAFYLRYCLPKKIELNLRYAERASLLSVPPFALVPL